MEIHRFETVWLAASLVLIVGFIATVTYGAVGLGIEMVDDEGGTIQNVENPADAPNFREPGLYRRGDSYEAYVIAQQFLFNPGTNEPLRLPADRRVTFYITSTDVVHGFQVPGTNLNTMVVPGQVTKITVEFDDTGDYGMVCNEYCGSGHHTMAGRIVVVPPSELEGGSS